MASMEEEVLSEYVKIRVNNILERENLLKNSGVLTDIGALKKTNVKDGHFQPYQKVCTCKEACQEEKEDFWGGKQGNQREKDKQQEQEKKHEAKQSRGGPVLVWQINV